MHNVVVELTVTQGGDSDSESVRVGVLEPEESIDVLQFGVASDGGPVEVTGKILADEGEREWSQRL